MLLKTRKIINFFLAAWLITTPLWFIFAVMLLNIFPLFWAVAAFDLNFCIRYFMGCGAPKGSFRSVANGISAVLSLVVILLYAFDLIEMHFMNLYSVPLHYNLLPWLLIYLIFRCIYWFAVGFIDKKRRENMPMWLLDEDVFLLGKVRNGKFYPDSDKCGFYAQSIDFTMYGRSLFESLEEAISVCGELPVIESESYIEE